MQPLLLLSLFFCHFLADYTHLSTAWMLKAKQFGTPVGPIFTHAFIHGSLMLVVITCFFGITGVVALDLFLIQVITHFLVDVWKGKMNVWFPALRSPANKWHWIVFGFDQFLHAVVIVWMVFLASVL